jgi:hypothetical protein
LLSKATFNVDPRKAVELKVVLIYHQRYVNRNEDELFGRLVEMVNQFKARYTLNYKPYLKIPVGKLNLLLLLLFGMESWKDLHFRCGYFSILTPII